MTMQSTVWRLEWQKNFKNTHKRNKVSRLIWQLVLTTRIININAKIITKFKNGQTCRLVLVKYVMHSGKRIIFPDSFVSSHCPVIKKHSAVTVFYTYVNYGCTTLLCSTANISVRQRHNHTVKASLFCQPRVASSLCVPSVLWPGWLNKGRIFSIQKSGLSLVTCQWSYYR